MVPTLEAELRAARASLERLASEPQSAETAASLGEVIRSLRRLERSASRLLPFLVSENAATRELLTGLAPSLPGELAARVAAAAAVSPRDESSSHSDRVNDANSGLRALLAEAIAALPDDAAGAAGCARIRDHFLTTARQRPW